MTSGQVVNRQRKVVTASGLQLEIFDRIASVSSMRVTGEQFQSMRGAMRSPSSNCLKTLNGTDMASAANERFERMETIQGIETVRVSRPNPDVTSWYSPKHGCALIAEEVKYRVPNDKPAQTWTEGRSSKTLISISSQEPSDELFAAPASFMEMPPSRLFAKNAKAVTGREIVCNPAADEAEDKRYFANRP